MALPRYSSNEVAIAWSGVPIDGLTPDSFATLSKSVDYTDEEVGSDGQLLVSVSPDNTGTCTISLQATSPSNLILSTAALGYQTGEPTVGDLTIYDPSGAVFVYMRNAYIKTAPEITLGITATGVSNDWTFFCEELIYTGAPAGLDSETLTRISSIAGSLIGG